MLFFQNCHENFIFEHPEALYNQGMPTNSETNQNIKKSSAILSAISGTLGVLSGWAAIGTGIAVAKKNALSSFWGGDHKVSTGVIYTLVSGALAIITGKLAASIRRSQEPSVITLSSEPSNLEDERKSTNVMPLSRPSTDIPLPDATAKPHQGYAGTAKAPANTHAERVEADIRPAEVSR